MVNLSLALTPITPLHHMDLSSVELETVSDRQHPASAQLADPEAPASPTGADLEVPISADSVVSAWHLEPQAESPDKALDWEALAWEADLQLQDLDQAPEATVQPQEVHQDISEAFLADQAFPGVAHHSAATQPFNFMVSHTILAKEMVEPVLAG